MKNVLLAIFVLLAAQPVQAVSCDMQDTGQSGQVQHGSMQHGSMDESPQGMDCCDPDPEDPNTGCTTMSYCGIGVSGMVAISPSTPDLVFHRYSQAPFMTSTIHLDGATTPPFRPPIA